VLEDLGVEPSNPPASDALAAMRRLEDCLEGPDATEAV
jgi:hypothetical protein